MSGAHHAAQGRTPATPLAGPVSRLAPEVKLVGLVAFLLVVAVTPPTRPWALAAQAAVAGVVAVAAFTPLRAVLSRLVIDAPLLVLAAVYAVAGRGPHLDVAGLQLSRPGLVVGLGVLTKATIGIVAVSAVAASTTAVETVVGLRRLRVPEWFCELLALVLRQLGLLREDVRRLHLATGVRAGVAGRRTRWSVAGRSFGALFVRSAERLDRLQLALAARGGGAFASAMTASLDRSAVTGPPSATSGPATTSGAAGAAGAIGWVWAALPAAMATAAALAGGWR